MKTNKRKFENNWQFKSLESLEKEVWPAVNYDSHLVKRTTALRKIPLNEFSIEDLRIMIGQNFSLPFLMPLAIERLEENIMAEGDFYPGDLLRAVTSVGNGFWKENADYRNQVEAIVAENISVIQSHGLELGKDFIK